MKFWKRSLSQLWYRARRIIPTRLFVILWGIGIVFVGIGAVFQFGWLVFVLYNGLLVGFGLIEIISMRHMPAIQVRREFKHIFEQLEKNEVLIHIIAEKPLYTEMWLQDDYPKGFWVDQRTFHLVWSGEEQQSITYFAKPHRRGRHVFHRVHIRMMGRFRLFLYQLRFNEQAEVHVYPSLEPIRKVRKGVYYKENEEGSYVARSFGAGNEFSHLREYIPDDESRHINWLATARAGKLVSNVYQPEIGQQVAILVDCGRLMGIQDEGSSRLDVSLEAALGFAAIALQRGDRVSFLAFSNKVLRWVPFGVGMKHLRKIVEESYDLEPSYVETDYLSAWEHLTEKLKQRTLIAIFTDMSNLSFSETMDQMIRLTKRKHLILSVSMQDPHMIERLKQLPTDEKTIYDRLVIEELMDERKTTLRKWASRHFVSLDVAPEQLASAVIYKYLEIRNHLGLNRLRASAWNNPSHHMLKS